LKGIKSPLSQSLAPQLRGDKLWPKKEKNVAELREKLANAYSHKVSTTAVKGREGEFLKRAYPLLGITPGMWFFLALPGNIPQACRLLRQLREDGVIEKLCFSAEPRLRFKIKLGKDPFESVIEFLALVYMGKDIDDAIEEFFDLED
jgi:hypothetical protein